MTTEKADFDDWSEHGEFLRRLARELVGDHHAAEDVVQDAQVAAISGAPTHPQARRAWLVRVVRNLSANLHRANRRRRERERAVAKPDATRTSDVGTRLELQGRLIALIRELDEPYQSVVYLRFYEGLPPRAIAARQGVSVHTVKSRLQRALGRVRTQLDGEFGGDRRTWCALLSVRPLGSDTPIAASAAAFGGLLMKIVVAAGLFVVAVCVTLFSVFAPRVPLAPSQLPVAEASRLDPSENVTSIGVEREEVADAQVPAADPSAAESTKGGWLLVGSVRDGSGAPIAGAAIDAALWPSPVGVVTTSDGDGRYRLVVPMPVGISSWTSLRLRASATARGYEPGEQTRSGLCRASDDRRVLAMDFTLASKCHARGWVHDIRGSPVAGAAVALVGADGTLRGSGRCGSNGAFFLGLPELGRVWFLAGSPRSGCVLTGPHEVSAGDDLDLGVVWLEARAVLEATVVFPDGSPVSDTEVEFQLTEPGARGAALVDDWLALARNGGASRPRSLAGHAAGKIRTDARGHFRLAGVANGRYRLAFPELSPRDPLVAGPLETGTHEIVRVEAYRVRVRVVDQDGLAVPGVSLTVARGTYASLGSTRGLDATTALHLSPGSWVVSASANGARPAEQLLEVSKGQFEHRVELLLDFEPALGELQVFVTDERGRAVTDFEVRLWREDSSALVADFSGLVPGPDGLLPPIPAGDYKARVTFPGRTGTGGDYLAIDTRATIVGGGRAVLRLGSQAGGRLFFRIESRPGRDVPVSITLDGGLGRRQVGDLFDPASGRSVPLRLGASGLSSRMAAGSYRLRATAAGCEAFEQTVHVVAGEITEVRVPMQAR